MTLIELLLNYRTIMQDHGTTEAHAWLDSLRLPGTVQLLVIESIDEWALEFVNADGQHLPLRF